MKGFPQLHGFKSQPGFVRLIGHRGARGLMPENTIEGFEYTLDLGVMALEFDVLLSKDNVPVITHDNCLSGQATVYSGQLNSSLCMVGALNLRHNFSLDVEHSPDVPGALRLTWPSNPAKQYDVLVSADLSSPIESWAELEGSQNITADPSGTNTLDIDRPFPGLGFLAIRAKDPPPLFSEDFENGDGGWTNVTTIGCSGSFSRSPGISKRCIKAIERPYTQRCNVYCIRSMWTFQLR